MLVYYKEGKLRGTLGNLPQAADAEVEFRTLAGVTVDLEPNDFYYDSGIGAVKRASDNEVLELFIDNVKIIPSPAAFDTIVPKFSSISKYLKEITVDNFDYEYADWFFNEYLEEEPASMVPACTSVVADGKLYRNFDWYYNDDVAFIVHTAAEDVPVSSMYPFGHRYASTAVADSVPGLTSAQLESGQYTAAYRMLPFYVTDGYNEAGLAVSMNVVPKQRGTNEVTIPWESSSKNFDVHASALPRYILDNFTTAKAAAEYVYNYARIHQNKSLCASDYDLHYIISDTSAQADEAVYVIEIMNDRVYIASKAELEDHDLYTAITNFHLFKPAADTSAVSPDFITVHDKLVATPESAAAGGAVPTEDGLTTHAAGLERYNLIASNWEDLSDFRNLVYYNKAYTLTSDKWYSEFVGKYSDTLELTVDSTPEAFEATVMPIVERMYANRTRSSADTWHTSHTSIYDFEAGTLTVYDASEDNAPHVFTM